MPLRVRNRQTASGRPRKMPVREEMPNLALRARMIRQQAVGEGQDDVIGSVGQLGRGDADLAIAGAGHKPRRWAWQNGPIAGNNAHRIIDWAKQRVDHGRAVRDERWRSPAQDRTKQAVPVKKIRNLAAAIGRPEHHDMAQRARPLAVQQRARDEAAHGMRDDVQWGLALLIKLGEAREQPVADALKRQAPAVIAQFDRAIARAAQRIAKRLDHEARAGKAMKQDDGGGR